MNKKEALAILNSNTVDRDLNRKLAEYAYKRGLVKSSLEGAHEVRSALRSYLSK